MRMSRTPTHACQATLPAKISVATRIHPCARGFSTQQWRVTDLGSGMCTIQQVSSGRFLDAPEVGARDFRVVTRPQQKRGTQIWRIEDFGGGFISIQQVSSGRFLEATLGGDFSVVARPAVSNEQTWRIGDP